MLSTLLLSATASLLAVTNPASASPTPILEPRQNPENTTQQLDEMRRFFFTNCWANSSSSGGAISEIDWYFEYPTQFGSAVPNLTTTVSDGSNAIWENGGNANVTNGDGYADFSWMFSENATSAAAGEEVGIAYATAPVLQQTISVPSIQYTLVKQSEEVLYSRYGLDCRAIYEGIANDGEI